MQKLLKHIQQSLLTLPNAQRSVAEYVLAHYMDIPFLSVTSLAREIGVSDTTIVKFCAQLGFDGFSDFKHTIAEHIQAEVTMYGNLERRLGTMEEGNTLGQVMNCDIHNLEATLNNPINRENFDAFLELLEGSERLFVFGLRTASMQAEYLAASLRVQNRNVVTFSENGHFVDQLCQITPNDLFIMVSFSRYSMDSIRAIKYLTARKVPCVAITDSTASPAYGLADLSFICESQSYSYQASYASCSSLINAIITALAMRHKDETTDHLRDLESAFRTFDMFFSYEQNEGNL